MGKNHCNLRSHDPVNRRSFRSLDRIFQKLSVVLIALSITTPAWAELVKIEEPENKGLVLTEQDRAIRKKLAEQIERMMQEPQLAEKIRQVGERRTIFCRICHGKDGNAVRPGVPNLAGQNPVYLLDQFQRFSDGRRYDYTMTSLASAFSTEEKIYLALYFSQMTPKPAENVDAAQWARGKVIYETACMQCHGKTGRGEKGYARLAAQKADYIVKMLKEFRRYTGRRSNPYMSAVVIRMTDQEMADVAAYLSAMK